MPATPARNEVAWNFYESIGSPRYVVAPMVDQSELAFRLQCRRHGAELCYTPMLHSRIFAEDPKYRAEHFRVTPEDRPLFAQFCGHDPQTMLAAAKLVEDECDAVDINLGCPQGIAKKGRYGSFLLSELDLLHDIVSTMTAGLKIPVTCKIRILDSEEATLKLVKTLVDAGCKLLTVHGRTKEMNKDRVGAVNWDIIRVIRESINIPLFVNGGIYTVDDVHEAMRVTGAQGVMTSEAILENPWIFDGKVVCDENQDAMAAEYLRICQESDYIMPVGLKCMRAHLFKFLFTGLQSKENHDLREKLSATATFEEMLAVSEELARRRKTTPSTYHLTWYMRHRGEKKSHQVAGDGAAAGNAGAGAAWGAAGKADSDDEVIYGNSIFD